jgi:hypothetical protein
MTRSGRPSRRPDHRRGQVCHSPAVQCVCACQWPNLKSSLGTMRVTRQLKLPPRYRHIYLNLATLEYSTRRSGGKVTQMSVCASAAIIMMIYISLLPVMI